MEGKVEIKTMHAERLWGRGRWVRRAWRLYCRVRGHDWNPWHFDYPEELEGPSHGDPLFWLRGCDRDCGCVQTCMGPSILEAVDSLPGRIGMDVTNYRRTSVV